jgi:hypothetical protein
MALNEQQREAFGHGEIVNGAKLAAGNDREKLAELDRLCAQLCGHNELFLLHQVEQAFKKYSDGILYGIKIFVSYKKGFEKAALQVVEPFKIYGNGRICTQQPFPYIFERANELGQDYRDKIYDALEQSHWFFLILPDQTLDRSWTLFEAGYFKRAMAIEDRLIGIHHSKVEMAGPLKNLEAVRAEKETICSFLQRLLQEPNPIPGMSPINRAVSAEKLQSEAESISNAIQPSGEIWRQYRIDYVDIKIKAGRLPGDVEELLDAVVIEAAGLEKIFNFAGRAENTRLETIVMQSERSHAILGQGDKKDQFFKRSKHYFWLKAVVEAIQAAVNNKPYEPSDVILVGEDQRFYRPTLLSIRRYTEGDEPESAHIAFHESVTGPIRNCPNDLSTLGTLLRMGYRFKWELLENFRFVRSKADVDSVCRIIERMERESHQRGFYQPDQPVVDTSPVLEAFPPELQPAIQRMTEKWLDYRNPTKTGRLDQAFQQGDARETQECLRELKEINKEFMELGTKRYAELVKEYWI